MTSDNAIYTAIFINGVRVPPDRLMGEISVEIDESAHSVLTFTLRNDDDVVPGVMTPPRSPQQKTFSMIGQKVEFVGGYRRDNKRLFSGVVYNSRPNYSDDGMVTISLEAKSRGYTMSNKSRNEVYPRVGKRITTDEQSPRSAVNLPSGEQLSLSTLVRALVEEYGLEIGVIDARRESENGVLTEVYFDDVENPIHQTDMTDWEFLQRLADKYHCQMWIDEDTGLFHFLTKELIKTEQPSGQIEFYYHRPSSDESIRYYTPRNRFRPWSNDTALPITSISMNIDVDNVRGGVVQQSRDLDGNLVLSASVVDDEGKLGFERLVLDDAALTSPAADEFLRDFSLADTGWEETKQFWNTVDVEHVDASDTRNNPPFHAGANMTCSTTGCIHVRPFSSYYFHNLGFPTTRWKAQIVSLTHTFTDGVYTMQLGVLIW